VVRVLEAEADMPGQLGRGALGDIFAKDAHATARGTQQAIDMPD
jgi:hypothetical protein